jgi:mono/diheme cytochrome c family protein
VSAFGLQAYAVEPSGVARAADIPVTAVAGESWLSHLHRSFDNTSMGKTGHLGPPAPEPGAEVTRGQSDAWFGVAPQTVTLHGSDLYRINCRGCHGEAGLGAPPEINSVINPVRATSVTMVMQRMKERGLDMSRADATELAKQAQTALLLRLHQGGENMPPFPHLSEAEIRALVGYLNQLAGVPGAAREPAAITEPALRVGEHIVKSTCHTCHDAAGPDPTPQQLEDGAIPPLETLTTRTNLPGFVRKVTAGAPIVMGTPPTPHRSRMPVFYYLSRDEAADVYLYLSQYPPSQMASSNSIVLGLQDEVQNGGPSSAAGGSSTEPAPNNQSRMPAQTSEGPTLTTTLLLLALGGFVVLLLVGGLAFTMLELQKLSAESETRTRIGDGHGVKSDEAKLVAQ